MNYLVDRILYLHTLYQVYTNREEQVNISFNFCKRLSEKKKKLSKKDQDIFEKILFNG